MPEESRPMRHWVARCPNFGYNSGVSVSRTGRGRWDWRLRSSGCRSSLLVGIFSGPLLESLDGRGIETSICGKLPLDRAFHWSALSHQRKNVKFRINSVFSGVCRVVHFMCNLLIPQVRLEFSGIKMRLCTGFSTVFVDNFLRQRSGRNLGRLWGFQHRQI